MPDNISNNDKKWSDDLQTHQRNSRLWIGILILVVGLAALIKVSFTDLPGWLFTWPMILIMIGLFYGFRQGFRGVGWLIMIVIGTAFLVDRNFIDLNMQRYIWPLAIIAVGLIFILRHRGRHSSRDSLDEKRSGTAGRGDALFMNDSAESGEDYVEATTIFGGISRNIVSKNFRGGDIVVLFGGSELNFNQADIQQPAVIHFTVIFGGTKIIVPSDWVVKTEMTPLFGGLEDKRSFPGATRSPEKILLLKGTVLFGGIEVKSY